MTISEPSHVRDVLAILAGVDASRFVARYPHRWLLGLGEPAAASERGAFRTIAEGARQTTPSDMRISPEAPVWVLRKRVTTFPTKIMIGRAANNDIVLPYPSLSKLHAYFSTEGDHLAVTDAGSRNGTFVNDQRLEPMSLHPVEDHDVVRFGATVRVAVLGSAALHSAVQAGLIARPR